MELDVKQFWSKAAREYERTAYKFSENNTRYPFYKIRLKLVLDLLRKIPRGKLLDAGCGGGSVLLECLKIGWDGYGCDIVEAMVRNARERLVKAGFEKNRVIISSVSDLRKYKNDSFDVIMSLGVMEYIPPKDEKKAFKEIRRVLKPDGLCIIENINSLFDLTTFNRFTVLFFKEHFLPYFFSDQKKINQLCRKIEALITYPDKPDKKGKYSTTRDHVYTKSENPLIYGKKVKGYGFIETDQAFYRFHVVPPLLFEQEPLLEKEAVKYELNFSRHWIGNFLASGFISVLKKCD